MPDTSVPKSRLDPRIVSSSERIAPHLLNSTRGLLLFDGTVDPQPVIELLDSHQFPFQILECEGYRMPTLETRSGAYVGETLIGTYLRDQQSP